MEAVFFPLPTRGKLSPSVSTEYWLPLDVDQTLVAWSLSGSALSSTTPVGESRSITGCRPIFPTSMLLGM